MGSAISIATEGIEPFALAFDAHVLMQCNMSAESASTSCCRQAGACRWCTKRQTVTHPAACKSQAP